MEQGKAYWYERGCTGCAVRGVYLRSTPAWDIFLRDGREDWVKSYRPKFSSEEEFYTVRGIVEGMAKNTRVPDVVLAPVGSPKDGR